MVALVLVGGLVERKMDAVTKSTTKMKPRFKANHDQGLTVVWS